MYDHHDTKQFPGKSVVLLFYSFFLESNSFVFPITCCRNEVRNRLGLRPKPWLVLVVLCLDLFISRPELHCKTNIPILLEKA